MAPYFEVICSGANISPMKSIYILNWYNAKQEKYTLNKYFFVQFSYIFVIKKKSGHPTAHQSVASEKVRIW